MFGLFAELPSSAYNAIGSVGSVAVVLLIIGLITRKRGFIFGAIMSATAILLVFDTFNGTKFGFFALTSSALSFIVGAYMKPRKKKEGEKAVEENPVVDEKLADNTPNIEDKRKGNKNNILLSNMLFIVGGLVFILLVVYLVVDCT